MFDLPSDITKKPIRAFLGRLLLAHVVIFALCFVIAGCGGGYAGGVIPSLSSSQITIDGGQSFMAVANNPSNFPLTWTVSGAGCSGATCGTISDMSALGVTYVAPAVTQQLKVTLTGTVTGAKVSTSTAIVVNPAPTITGSTPDGTVGTPYSATFAVSGGTPTVKWLPPTGSLPEGLSFDSNTGILSGTPTVVGSSSFTLKAIDSSDVPFTVTSSFTVKVNASTTNPTPLKATGTTPDGTVNTPYSAVLQATGGTAPYTWSILTGTLPAGLSISSAGVISGTPTTAGTSSFTAQVKDSTNATATLPLTLKINAASTGATLGIATSTLPSGTVQVAYAASITITGGTAPYTCTVDSGSLPAGLTLGSNCAVTGLPTTAGTSTFTVHATDASNPSISGTGLITIVINPAPAVLVISSPPPATVGLPYSGAVEVTGGTAPYHCVLASGAMPAGLTLGANCVVSGLPLVAGTTSVGVTATDSANPANTTTATVTITVQAPLVTLTITAPPVGVVNVPYVGAILVAGGTAPYTCSVVSGTLPNGLTLNSNCTITGTPQTPGTSTVGITVTDSASPANTKTDTVNITIVGAPVVLTITAPPVGIVGVPYVGGITVLGGVAPYTCSVASGALPNGLTLNSNCTITGTPQTAGTSSVGVTITDSANPANTTTAPVSITIVGSLVTLTITAPPVGIVGVPYVGGITVLGGVAPYTCTVASGALPAGLTLNSNCTITGTPQTAGMSSVSVTVTDSASPANTTTAPVSITILGNLITLSITAPPVGIVGVPYVGGITVLGGTAPYTCTVASGTLPNGLTLNPNCSITGTPQTAGMSSVTVTVKDSANPANTATAPVSITILGNLVTLTITAPPVGIVGVPYVGGITVLGGVAPYTCSVTSGALPNGLTLNHNCTITGTPQTAGTSTVGVMVTDSASPANTKTDTVTITITGGLVTLTLTTPPVGIVGVPYIGGITVLGGIAPYTCSVASGALPAGLTLNSNCLITGTPTLAGTYPVSILATDSANPANTTTAPVTITIQGALITLTLTAPPVGVVNVPYIGAILVLGGTPPYTCSVASGTLPSGLTLNSNCTITGTPTSAGNFSVNVAVHDSASPVNSNTSPVPITILGLTSTLTLSAPANATVNTPYNGAIGVTGGTAPYTCVINSGTLPAGLTMGANCTITGTPTTAGTSMINVTATDSASPAKTGTATVAITVSPINALSLTGALPNATLGVAYTQTLAATGGLPPYTYSVTSGTLPAGLSLSGAGVISGTPTAVGASSFTITATDSQATPQQAANQYTLQVVYPTTPSDALLKGPYAFLFQGYDDVVAGVLAYQTATIGSITADGQGLLTAGELDSNHQSSNPTGNTIATNGLLGTYTLGTDGRGTLAVTTMNADGTAGNTALYALALKLPTAPATASASGSMIESDGNILLATKGSGTLLAQNTSVYSNGLTGNYAFGVEGDTPCLPTCTIGIIAGPVATVGQFTANGGTITGVSDANIATTNYNSSALSGSSSAADTNGRIGLTLNSQGLTGVAAYPTHYAVYLVDATHAFLMSTDKHSSSILQAGTAQAQATSTFSNASLSGNFVGYENAAVNPGIVGQALGSVLNLSSATIIQGTGNSNGTCATNKVDVGGATGLVNALTGLGSGSNLVNAVLGTHQTTGNSSCVVGSNGRAVFNYPQPTGLLSALLALVGLGNNPAPPRVVYLTGNNAGYFLETGYAGLGHLEAQAAGPFTLANLNGTYTYGTVPASSLATINGDGTFTADGAGNVTSTTDTNVGVGNLNILQLGVTGNSTYTVSDAAAGRYLINGTRVVYALSPGRFIVLEGGALSTAPYTALLY